MQTNQTVLVAGATGNIGRAATQMLANRGVRVVHLGRNPDRLSAKAHLIREEMSSADIGHRPINIEILTIDFSDMAFVRAAATEALNRFPTIYALAVQLPLQFGITEV